jgi:hypothetical protein
MKIKEIEKQVAKIMPEIEERVAYKIARKIADILHEEIYPPESMFRKEFIKEVKEALKEVKSGKLITKEKLEKIWKKEHGKI